MSEEKYCFKPEERVCLNKERLTDKVEVRDTLQSLQKR